MSRLISLQEGFEAIPDPRQASGRHYPLGVILTLVATAMLAGARSLYAIAQLGRDRGRRFACAVGFRRGKTPCCTTLNYLFRALDVPAFEGAIRRWAQARGLPGAERGGPAGVGESPQRADQLLEPGRLCEQNGRPAFVRRTPAAGLPLGARPAGELKGPGGAARAMDSRGAGWYTTEFRLSDWGCGGTGRQCGGVTAMAP